MDALSVDSGLGMSSPESSPVQKIFPEHQSPSICVVELANPRPTPEREGSERNIAEQKITTRHGKRGSIHGDEQGSSSPVSLEDVVGPQNTYSRAAIALPKVMDKPEIQVLSSQLDPKDAGLHSKNTQLAEELHTLIERNEDGGVLRLLRDERCDPDILRAGSSTSPLHRALGLRALNIAIYLVLAGADLETENGNGEGALVHAVRCEFPDDFILLLCEMGVVLNTVDFSGRSALHYAADLGPEDCTIPALCSHGADVNKPDASGCSPLLSAVLSSCLLSSIQLLEFGANVNATMSNGMTALHVAITTRSRPLVQLLCNRGAFVDGHLGNSTALLTAITSAATDIASILLEADADPNLRSVEGRFPLLAASTLGYKKIVELLLAKGANVYMRNQIGTAPLHVAALKNYVPIIRMLLAAGTPVDQVNHDGATPLEFAVMNDHVETVQCLLEHGANANQASQSQSLLWRALNSLQAPSKRTTLPAAITSTRLPRGRLNPKTSILLLLLDYSADATTPHGPHDITPLHEAATLGLDSVLERMLASRLPVDTPIWSGHTPLYFAAEGGHLSTVRRLIETHGANPLARTTAEDTLLFAATGHPDVLRYLLGLPAPGSTRRWSRFAASHGIFDVNHRNANGATALHFAAVKGHLEGARVLLQKGARQFLANAVYDDLDSWKEGRDYRQGTPAGLARQRGFDKVADLIERF